MIEMIVNPKKAERKPWEMFFVGFLYAIVAVLLVDWIFLNDIVLSQYTSILIITFTVIFSIPFMYFIFKIEEEKDIKIRKERKLLKEHGRALAALLFLFLGFTVAFSIMYIVMPSDVTAQNFQAQITQYCAINMPSNIEGCVSQYGVSGDIINTGTMSGETSSLGHVGGILVNNIFVMIFVLIFSLAFGAGAIFILAWNAGVIASAIGIFTQAKLISLHCGLARYMIHGIPEIGGYFVAALAGGIISIAIIRHDYNKKEFWRIMKDSINMILLAIGILIIAAIIEVFITPVLFPVFGC